MRRSLKADATPRGNQEFSSDTSSTIEVKAEVDRDWVHDSAPSTASDDELPPATEIKGSIIRISPTVPYLRLNPNLHALTEPPKARSAPPQANGEPTGPTCPGCHRADDVVPFLQDGFWYCHAERLETHGGICGRIFTNQLPNLVHSCPKCNKTILTFEHHTGCGFGLSCPTCKRFYPMGSKKVAFDRQPVTVKTGKSPYDQYTTTTQVIKMATKTKAIKK